MDVNSDYDHRRKMNERGPELRPGDMGSVNPDDLPEGYVISGVYKVLEKLGSGGMSHVYRCHDLSLNRYVAIKVLRAEIGSNPLAVMRFQREGMSIAVLSHPNIVKIHAMQSTESGQPYLVMEIVTGTPLSEIVERTGPMPLFRVSKFVTQICSALEHAHDQDIVHRDLKPSNLMLINPGRPDEYIKILDFGIAKVMTEDSVRATQTGETVGSPIYMSPEQSLGKSVDPKSDQYSLACVIFELLTGHPPFEADNPLQIMMAHVQDDPPSLKKLSRKEFPDYVEKTLAKMLSKDPHDRFDRIMDVPAAFLGESKVKAKRTSAAKRSSGSSGKKMLIAGAGILSLLLGISFTVKTFWPASSPPAATSTNTTTSPTAVSPNTSANPRPVSFVDSTMPPTVPKLTTDSSPSHSSDSSKLNEDERALIRRFELGVEGAKKYVILSKWCPNITDAGLEALCKQPQIRSAMRIDLHGCIEFTDKGLEALATLPVLQELNVIDTKVTDAAAPSFQKMPSLLNLEVDKTSFGDNCVKALLNGPSGKKLRFINVGETYVTGKSMRNFAQMPSLEKLELRTVEVPESSLADLVGSKKLFCLKAQNLKLKGTCFAALSKMKPLKVLQLSRNEIEPSNLVALQKSNVEDLDLSMNSLSDDALDYVVKVKQLKSLNLGDNAVTSAGLMKLLDMPNLEMLRVKHVPHVTQVGCDDFQAKYEAKHKHRIKVVFSPAKDESDSFGEF